MMIRNDFQIEKAVAALAYILEHSRADLYAAMKIMYLADRTHLEKYGRLIAGDSYYAMPNGPTPDGAYNLLKSVKYASDREVAEPARGVFEFRGENSFAVARRPDYDELSVSDVECIEAVIGEYPAEDWVRLRDAAHDKAWSAVWENRGSRADFMPLEVIAGALGEDVLAHVKDPFPGNA